MVQGVEDIRSVARSEGNVSGREIESPQQSEARELPGYSSSEVNMRPGFCLDRAETSRHPSC